MAGGCVHVQPRTMRDMGSEDHRATLGPTESGIRIDNYTIVLSKETSIADGTCSRNG